uniref:Uncharacterized protein n=1 Tax=Setaria italica TaxID=4555 RepID=K3YXJ6_SETIT
MSSMLLIGPGGMISSGISRLCNTICQRKKKRSYREIIQRIFQHRSAAIYEATSAYKVED